MRRKEHGADDAIETVRLLHEKRKAETAHIKQRHQHDGVKRGDLGGLPEQRIAHHLGVVGKADETVGAETVHLIEAEHQRQQHRQADEYEEAQRVGEHEQIAGDPFAVLGAELPAAALVGVRHGHGSSAEQ
jgi:hypothetical protein